jgi:DNA segregation ATPase FtsK/SpoIIIE-like protein
MAYQLAHSTEDVRLALIDLEGATLAPFANCNRVMWPLADTEQDAIAVMHGLTDELDRRRDLYSEYTEQAVDSLYRYNEVAREPLPPLVLIADEITALMEDKDVESNLRTLSLRGRKYGLWLMLAGQDWKASTLSTTIRNQLATCIQFKARDATQSRILLGHPDAADISVQGRAFAWLPGRDLVEMQAPIIELGTQRGNGPIYPMPEATREQSVQDDKADRVRQMYADGESLRTIEKAIFGYAGGAAHDRVTDILSATIATKISQDG